MAKVRVRPETGCLYLDFSWRGKRCREQTALVENPANRRVVESLATRVKRAIAKGTFAYRDFFPGSPRASHFDKGSGDAAMKSSPASVIATPTFGEFSETWYQENLPRKPDRRGFPPEYKN